MRALSIFVIVVACGSKPPPSAPVPDRPSPPADDGDATQAMDIAYRAATDWNMAQTGMTEGVSDADKTALQQKAEKHLKIACENKNACACTALKTGRCNCPDEPSCSGEPYWFLASGAED